MSPGQVPKKIFLAPGRRCLRAWPCQGAAPPQRRAVAMNRITYPRPHQRRRCYRMLPGCCVLWAISSSKAIPRQCLRPWPPASGAAPTSAQPETITHRVLPLREDVCGVTAGQSWRISMNTGICRVVLAWCSPTAGDCATSFGHSSARAVSSSSSASTVNVWVPTSTVIVGLAFRL